MLSSNLKVRLTFPEKTTYIQPKGITGNALIELIDSGLAKKILAIEVNGEIWDLSRPINQDAHISWVTWDTPRGKQVFWHSTAHLMAEALEALYPGIRLGIGPPIAQGFYYDVDFGQVSFDQPALAKVEKKIKTLLQKKNRYERIAMPKTEALAHYTQHPNPYKIELIQDLKDGTITFYRQGNFIDLCKGPHLPHTGYIKAVKLLSIAGAYWKGNTDCKQLTRIYGISFPSQALLDQHMDFLAEAQKRDHRLLGKTLQLFTFSEKVGSGLPLWLPKGTFVREKLIEFLQQAQQAAGYQNVTTSHIAHKNLYVASGHYGKYKECTFQPIQTSQSEDQFLLKPMNCPHHCTLYKAQSHSYKSLPIRLAEFGTVYRYEQSGTLHGLIRARSFTQDDAHIFCRPDQVKEEVMQVIELILYVLDHFHFQGYQVQLSLRDPQYPDKYMGDIALWETAEKAMRDIVVQKELPATVALGEAAFYGPKLDFMVQDALGRPWQLGTVQIDYQLPERFDLNYIGSDNKKHRPVIIHRAPLGSLERFIAILLEHTAGRLPLWLCPEQVIVLPVSMLYRSYAVSVAKKLQKKGVRAHVDERDEQVKRKIRDAEKAKIPFMLIVGEKEASQQHVAVRQQGKGQQGVISLEKFIQNIQSSGISWSHSG